VCRSSTRSSSELMLKGELAEVRACVSVRERARAREGGGGARKGRASTCV
jgi:hypothetical protein